MSDEPAVEEKKALSAVAAADPQEEDDDDDDDEEDLEQLQAEIARMEAEAARISEETKAMETNTNTDNNNNKSETTATATAAKDGCSIYVGQVDYAATPEELLGHFEACGTVERVTIVCDKFTGKPKGFAYLEFEVIVLCTVL